MRTFNACIYCNKVALETRENLNAGQVCDFAREISAREIADRKTVLLVEQLWNGENEQEYLNREFPGATASGFSFRGSDLKSTRIDARCEDFMAVFGSAQ